MYPRFENLVFEEQNKTGINMRRRFTIFIITAELSDITLKI